VHNVSYAENILTGLSGRVIDDKGYLSEPFKPLLFRSGKRLIAKHKKNMELSPEYERELLKNDPSLKP
jgi:hypothetical protein